MQSKRIMALIGSLAVAAVALSGCAAADASADDAGNNDGKKTYEVYALLPQGNDQPYGTMYIPAMQEEAKKKGIELTITNSKYNADQQASECKVAIAAKPDLIILWPAVGDTVRPCLVAAKSAGIPVTVTNSDVNPDDKGLTMGFSGPDTYGQGEASAEIMCDLVGDEEVGILMVNGLTGNSTATTRRAGFVDHVKDNCPNVKILAEQPGNWNKDDSQIAVSEMLTSVGPENVDGIYAADDTMVSGAIAALKARGIDPKPLYITSIGNTKLGNPLVLSGELDGTIFQSSSWDGSNAIVLAYEVLTSGKKAEDMLMPSVKVTKENADDPAVAPEW